MSKSSSIYCNPSDVLGGAPGPSPWYLRADPPKLSGVSWIDAGSNNHVTAGKTLLGNKNGEIVAILDMYCYSLALGAQTLLIWHKGSSSVIDFVLLDLQKLPVIDDVTATLQFMYEKKMYLFHLASPKSSLAMSTNLESGKHTFEFPNELKGLEELLVLASLPRPPFLGIFCLQPKRNELEVFPQDWFNDGELDYGYQWVTRVARDAGSKKIYGEGIRISHFVLDDTNCQIEKWFHDDPFFEAQSEMKK